MITIIDYGVGNIGSVANTLARLGQQYEISSDPERVARASILVLPGVGAAGVGMQNLIRLGLDRAIRNAMQSQTPFMGFCLGMQLLFDYSEEANTPCLGILPGSVKKFTAQQKVPQIGWNQVTLNATNPYAVKLFQGIPPDSEFYFVNSYYPVSSDPSVIGATTEYGQRFTSVIATKYIFATQFHPEKSGQVGLQLIQNFLKEVI